MTAATVRETPNAFNTYQLDGIICPGTAVPSSGEASEKIDDQRSPLTTGANTVVMFSQNPVVTYDHTLITIEQLRAWDVWQAMLLEGRQRRPPRVYNIIDLRGTWLKRVIFEKVGMQQVDRPGGPWKRSLVLHTWNKVKPYGGPVKPGYLDPEIAEKNKSIADRAVRRSTAKQAAGFKNGKPKP